MDKVYHNISPSSPIDSYQKLQKICFEIWFFEFFEVHKFFNMDSCKLMTSLFIIPQYSATNL